VQRIIDLKHQVRGVLFQGFFLGLVKGCGPTSASSTSSTRCLIWQQGLRARLPPAPGTQDRPSPEHAPVMASRRRLAGHLHLSLRGAQKDVRRRHRGI
jgi:hypothetical protein